MRYTQPDRDAHGHALLTHFHGEKSYEIIERDDEYIEAGPEPKTYFSEFRDWPEHEKRAIKFARGRILDVGCGAGRHSLYLQRKGHDVTGIDIFPLAIKVCRLSGLKKVRVLSITQIDKLKPNSFDTVIMLGNNFGLFGSFDSSKALLRKFRRITSPNTLIVAETTDPFKTRQSSTPRIS